MRASKQRWVPSALVRSALWFCACNLLAAALAAQCTTPTQVPNGTYTSGDHSQVDNNALSASNFAVSGGATATFAAGNCIHLAPGFRANAIGATVPTTFHAWVDIAPSAVSVSPSSPPPNPPLTQSFTWTVSSPAGGSNLSHIFALFNTTAASTANACYIHYDASTNLVYLADNTSTTWLGGFAPSSSGSIGNSQCSIAGTSSSPNPTSSGTQLGLRLNVTFNAASFSGTKNEYLYALDSSGVSTGWQQMGTWTVPAPPAPDFTLTAITDSYYVQTGVVSYPSYTLTITPQNGFNGPVSFSMSWPMYGCGYPSFNPVQVAGPPWTTTVTMQCYETLQNGYWTTVTASGGGKSHQLNLYLFVAQGQQYFLTTAISPAGGGTIYPASGWYNAGTQVMVTAAANAGYQFTGFSGSLTGGSPGYVIMNANKSVTANFTQTASAPVITGISPTSGTVGTPVTITGTGFGTSGAVSFNGTPAQQIDSWSPTTVIARVPAGATTGAISLSTGGYQTSYQAQQFQVTAIGVTVSPPSVTVGQGQTQQFTATVTGTTNQQVTWSVAPTGAWSISSAGLFTAPGTIAALQTVIVTATSAAQQTATGTATVSLVPPTPTITSLSLPSGPAQVGFVINGSNFGSAQGSVAIKGLTGGDRALTVISWNSNSITVQVPSTTPQGAGQVQVTTSGNATSNQVPFTVSATFGCNF